jgi:hypothetical protein
MYTDDLSLKKVAWVYGKHCHFYYSRLIVSSNNKTQIARKLFSVVIRSVFLFIKPVTYRSLVKKIFMKFYIFICL